MITKIWILQSGLDLEYCCFSRSGFSEDLQAVESRRDDVHLFTVADVVDGLSA
ncbi:hypothetical protein [Natronoglomus mannanivorans]|uniref:hypothetical protein n=1 Tax=Natronoglomus mannanivorans TaxID=2979990 RepID=UPI00308282ED